MLSEWVDFKKIKAAVSIEAVMQRYGVELRRVNKSSLRGACPLPTHTSKTSPSLCVNSAAHLCDSKLVAEKKIEGEVISSTSATLPCSPIRC